MYELIDKYIDKLISSKPNMPMWNIEQVLAGKALKWNYIDGCMLTSILELYKVTKEKKYLDFLVNFVDFYVDSNGNIKGYNPENYSTDDMSESRILFDLLKITGNEKYKKAIELTYTQICSHPRTKEGNFWHKKIYPNQIWLDGLYMAQPFYARYETEFNKMKNYQDIISQFKNVRNLMFDEKKHLYYHGYDSSKSIFWADPKTGLSKSFWLRSIGWFLVALADVYEILDEQMYDERRYIGDLLKEALNGVLEYQDKESKMFYQVVDQGNRKGNYLEASGSSMTAYAILKATRLEILPERFHKIGADIFNGICNRCLIDNDGDLNLDCICLVAGLGPENNTRRNGTYEYYVSEPIVKNDAKGVGPFIMAYTEMIRK